MELEYFIDDQDATWPVVHEEWLQTVWKWLLSIGVRAPSTRTAGTFTDCH